MAADSGIRGEAKNVFTKVFRLVRAEVRTNIHGFDVLAYIRFVVYHYMLPYLLKICGFKSSIVYMFYGIYRKYTVFIKLYICGLTYRSYIRLRHKFRVDVVTYIPTLEKGPPSAVCCLLSATTLYNHRGRFRCG